MIIVIADDMTGAAEIAGIGHSYGLNTALVANETSTLPLCDLLVFATSTRQMDENDAVAETHRVCHCIKQGLPKLAEARQAAMTPLQRAQALARPDEILHIFKKTDTTLRGHVHLELRALVEESRYEQVMYMPADPSQGRTIRGGRYFVDGVPLDQTGFKRDSSFPATTANVAAAIDVMPGSRLRICDAEDAQDVHRTAKLALNNRVPTLLAGSTDLFCAFLEELGRKPARQKAFGGLDTKGTALIVCDSAQGIDLTSQPFVQCHNMAVIPMPQDAFEAIGQQTITEKEAADKWMGRLKQTQLVSGKTASFILTQPTLTGIGSAEMSKTLLQVTAEMVQRIVSGTNTYTELIFEGGDKAFSAMTLLGMTCFQVTNTIVPGIVRMKCTASPHLHLTVKTRGGEWGTLLH